jgi:hypothetical protein
MPVHLVRATAIAAASLFTAAAVALPAYADSRTFHDKVGDTGVSGDIKTVRVNHSEHRLIVVARTGNLLKADYITLWFDTKSGNASPEYKVVVRANSDDLQLRTVGAFGQKGHKVSCDGLRIAADVYASDKISVSIPRSCLQHPDQVRVSLRGRYIYAQRLIDDWAPTERRFLGWVQH